MNAIVGSNNTKGFDVAGSSIFGNVSASVGYFNYKSDGFRPNNDQDQQIFSAFGQAQLAPDTMAQVEFRARDLTSGDLFLFFDPVSLGLNRRDKENSTSQRVGLRQQLSPSSDILISLSRRSRDTNFLFPAFVTGHTADEGFVGEGQFMNVLEQPWSALPLQRVTTILGVGRAAITRDTSTQFFCDPTDTSCVPSDPSLDTHDLEHTNAYVYESLAMFDRLDLTVGASYEDFVVPSVDRTQLNPKLGASIAITEKINFRAAAFRTTTGTPSANQTLEPTQVAGFNQFYNDPEGTSAWHYGVGVDLKFLSSLYGGAEAAYRDVKFQIPDQSTGDTITQKHREYLARAHLYLAISDYWAFGVDYLEERFAHDKAISIGDFTVLSTPSIRANLGYHHPSGFSFSLRPRFIQQDGDFSNGFTPLDFHGADEFVLTEAELSYRLPRSLGKLSVVGLNLLNEKFKFQDGLPTRVDVPTNPQVSFERQVLFQFNVVFP